MALPVDPANINPRGLYEVTHSPPENFLRRNDFDDGWRFRCPLTDYRVEMRGVGAERGIIHFAHRWVDAIRHLEAAGLTPRQMLGPLGDLSQRFMEEANRERRLDRGPYRLHREQSWMIDQSCASITVMHAPLTFDDFFVETKEERAAREKAEKTARELLLMCLTLDQRKDFKKTSAFNVEVTLGVKKRRGLYRINKNAAFNVEHVESGTRYCVVAAESVPIYDQMLTQKLLLENEPDRFFRTANVSGGEVRWRGLSEYL